jgi:hypothetical protein
MFFNDSTSVVLRVGNDQIKPCMHLASDPGRVRSTEIFVFYCVTLQYIDILCRADPSHNILCWVDLKGDICQLPELGKRLAWEKAEPWNSAKPGSAVDTDNLRQVANSAKGKSLASFPARNSAIRQCHTSGPYLTDYCRVPNSAKWLPSCVGRELGEIWNTAIRQCHTSSPYLTDYCRVPNSAKWLPSCVGRELGKIWNTTIR